MNKVVTESENKSVTTHGIFNNIILLFEKIDINEVRRINDIMECKKQIDFALYMARFVMGEEYFNNAICWDIQENDYNYYTLKNGNNKLWPISLATRLFNLEERRDLFERYKVVGNNPFIGP